MLTQTLSALKRVQPSFAAVCFQSQGWIQPATSLGNYKLLALVETSRCPFTNLPETRSYRWGYGLTREEMANCRWLRPKLVAQIEFTEWTPDGHLRHSIFARLRDDKHPRLIVRE